MPAIPGTNADPSRLRWNVAFAIAVPLIVLDAFWVVQAERVGTGPYFTTISLFANVFFILSALLLLNVAARKFVPKHALSQAELLLIYSMVSIGAALAGLDMVPSLIQMLGFPYKFDSPGNSYLEHFGRFLPAKLMMSDPSVMKGYYEGHSTLYNPRIIAAWSRPAILWTLFVSMLFWTMQCINVLVRQGWQDRERLPFPVVEIPLQMTDPEGLIWKNKLFWTGFGLVASIEILNGLANLYPSLPSFNMHEVDISNMGIFATHPWHAVDFTCYSFYPFAIGLGYLLPLDLLFSTWFFYIFWKAQLVLSAALALDTTPDFPFIKQQAFGSFFAILVFMFWNGRHYFGQVWERIWNQPSENDDREEGLSFHHAALGALGGFAGLVLFMVWAGMSPLLAVAAFAIYFAIALTVTRIRAELGPPVHDLHFSGPDVMLTTILGTPAFSGREMTTLSFFYWFNRAHRSDPQPIAIEGLKVAKQVGSSQKVMFWGTILAALVGTAAVFWAYLHLAYALGTQAKFANGSSFAGQAFNQLNGWVASPTPPNGGAGIAMLGGFLFCMLLLLARTRFGWWPFHPIGFAISSSWAINLVWMPMFIAWIAKGLIMRYGGVRLYRQAMPFFIGMILGQMLVGSAWHLIGLALGITPYSFWGS